MKSLNRIVMATVIFAQTLSLAAPSTAPIFYAASEDLFRDFSPAAGIDPAEAMVNRVLSDISSQMGRNRWYIENLDRSDYYTKQYVQYLVDVNFNLSQMSKEMDRHRAEVRAYRNQEGREIYGQEQFKAYVEATARANPIRYSSMLSVLANQKSELSSPEELIKEGGEKYTDDWYRKFNRLVDAKEKASREYLRKELAEYAEIMRPINEFNSAEHSKATLKLYSTVAPLLVLEAMMKFDPVSEKSLSAAEINFLRVNGKSAPALVAEVYQHLLLNISYNTNAVVRLLSHQTSDGLDPIMVNHLKNLPVQFYNQEQMASFRASAGMVDVIQVRNPVLEQKSMYTPRLSHYTTAGLPSELVQVYMSADERINSIINEYFSQQSTQKLISLLYARAAAQLGVIESSDVLNVARAKLKQIEKSPRVMLEMLSVMNQLSVPNSKIVKAINKGKKEGKYPLSISGNMCGGHF